MYIWISLLSVTVITFTVDFLNPYYATNTKSMLHIGDVFWYMYGALLTQGWLKFFFFSQTLSLYLFLCFWVLLLTLFSLTNQHNRILGTKMNPRC